MAERRRQEGEQPEEGELFPRTEGEQPAETPIIPPPERDPNLPPGEGAAPSPVDRRVETLQERHARERGEQQGTEQVPPVSAADLHARRERAAQEAVQHVDPAYQSRSYTAVSADFLPADVRGVQGPPDFPPGATPPPTMGPGDPLPPPRAFFSTATSYLHGVRDFLASSVPAQVVSYDVDRAAVAADANGDRIVMEGTVMEMSTGQLIKPRTTGTAVGICRRRINLRDANKEVGLVIGGAVNVTKLWDNGTFGKSLGQLVADGVVAALPFIHFRNEDV